MSSPSSSEVIGLCSQVADDEGLVVTKAGSVGSTIIEACKSVGQVIRDLAYNIVQKLVNKVKSILESEHFTNLAGQYLFSKVTRDTQLKQRVISAMKAFFIGELGGAMIGYA